MGVNLVIHGVADGQQTIYGYEDQIPHGQEHPCPVNVLRVPDVAHACVYVVVAELYAGEGVVRGVVRGVSRCS